MWASDKRIQIFYRASKLTNLSQSEAIEIYTPYDVTNSRPQKMTIAFFTKFRGIEKLFCTLDQSLNLKIESVSENIKCQYICKISFYKKTVHCLLVEEILFQVFQSSLI